MLSLHFGKGKSFARFHCLDDGEEENDDRGYLFRISEFGRVFLTVMLCENAPSGIKTINFEEMK